MSGRRNELREFPPGVGEALQYYVYRYVDPRNDETFYVGKGVGNRIFAHLNEADDAQRKGKKVSRIRDVWNSGNDARLVIHRHKMTEKEAFNVEAALIELFPQATNEVSGHHSFDFGAQTIDDLIVKYAAAPATINFPAVLINIRQLWNAARIDRTISVDAVALYEATRKAWKINPNRHFDVKHAIACADGVIRQIYSIDHWNVATMENGNSTDEPDRWLFEGRADEEKANLIGRSIRHLQEPGAQNPILWLDKGSTAVSDEGSVG